MLKQCWQGSTIATIIRHKVKRIKICCIRALTQLTYKAYRRHIKAKTSLPSNSNRYRKTATKTLSIYIQPCSMVRLSFTNHADHWKSSPRFFFLLLFSNPLSLAWSSDASEYIIFNQILNDPCMNWMPVQYRHAGLFKHTHQSIRLSLTIYLTFLHC